MDPRKNPYAPGAGTPPPELAGRYEIIERAAIALDRIRDQKAARGIILYGLRGVGKTVLLNHIRREAEAREFISIQIEVPEGRSLPAALILGMHATLKKLSLSAKIWDLYKSTFKKLADISKSLKIKYHDIEIVIDTEPSHGIAESGDFEFDLIALFQTIGAALKSQKTALVIYIDELQYIEEAQLAALITALHNAAQEQLPITMVAAGLPQLLGRMGKAKSYAERLFEFINIGPLDHKAACNALTIPAHHEGVSFDQDALDEIIAQTKGYPYFLQEWGKHSWAVAKSSPIKKEDVQKASVIALAELDTSFFRVRFDRLTPSEKNYLYAMSELGEGPHRSGDIADKLGRKSSTTAPTRNSLIIKGMIYSPSHGDTAFTVPLFDGFMKRTRSPSF